MTSPSDDTTTLDSALDRSRDAEWRVRRDAVESLGRFVDDDRARDRLLQLVLHDDNLAVIERATAVLVVEGGQPGLTGLARVFDQLDDQAGSYAALAVSDALDDTVFEKLLATVENSDDPRVHQGVREIGLLIGMPRTPFWQRAFPT